MQNNLDFLTRFLVDQYSFPAEETLLLSKFKRVNVKKNCLLLTSGEVCQYAYFICNGCLRTYFIDGKGEEKTRYIAFENKFVSAFASFITQAPSAECVQALEDSELLRIRQADFYQLVDTNAIFSKLYRQSLEQAQVIATWRIETMISMTAKERYENLLERMPQVVLRLSNKHVASFLGITQESLSRLKKKG
ncbi:CRP-like cAMP-binding protein [Chitinophaga niastensis]|uniref:CRP-like cAMP-binding protein n=1 Tax=Chitinophaga niastensis TaxID=536980 RepID=A0A2P8HHD9_CHINA|nr:Crp/Fnr family transcriptional regulator [Chitinophaga niastensis]PSL45648.1 CRP-like cAMP-binding protein [Chitinophaga niastensis]